MVEVFRTTGPVSCKRFLDAYLYSDRSGKNRTVY